MSADDVYAYSSEGRQSTKQRRVKVLNDSDVRDLPESYTCNSNKEELCLEFVRHFNANYERLYPERKPLFLICPNEYGVDKFVCTTVRPTLLPFREVYDLEKTAEFVSNYLDYEPLEIPTEPPSCLPSPAQVIGWSVGDSYDFAVLLTSFLLGAGYDAFVVSGTAPRWVTLRDMSRSKCPLVVAEAVAQEAKDAEIAAQPAEEKPSKYMINPRGVPSSQFQAKEEAKRRAAAAKPTQEWVSDDDSEDGGEKKEGGPEVAESKYDSDVENMGFTGNGLSAPKEDDDEHKGKRMHAWVLVRGRKGDPEKTMVFVEPTTGTVYPVAEAPYLSIDGIWNNKNFWVNMQAKVPIQNMSFDTLNTDFWEYVFIDPANTASSGGAAAEDGAEEEVDITAALDLTAGAEGGGDEGGEGKGADEEDEENILDIPPSWVSKLVIERSSFKLKYPPVGQRTLLYHKAKLELFAENMHLQGTVSRLTLYKDRAQTVVKECREAFTNRHDKLAERIRFPLEGKTVERFLPGRAGSLKESIEWTGRRREVYLYVSARQDGLVKREEDIGRKITELFEGRTDNLVYRSVSVREDSSGATKPQHTLPSGEPSTADLVTQKMTLKFARNPDKPADQDIAKRTFYLQEGRIRTLYHYAESRITRETTTHYKDRHVAAQHNKSTSLGATDANEVGESLAAVLSAERDCLQEIRRAQLEMNELLKIRRREEADVVVDRPIFDTARERRVEEKQAEIGGETDMQVDKFQVDYLTPFLSHQGADGGANAGGQLSREDAQRARDSCLKSLKDRLLERANIIQNRLNHENGVLSKKQATFQRNSSRDNDPAAEAEFEKFCSEAMFRIQILEQRLVNHEETALKKYQDLDEKLTADPRLTVLNNV
mmetsp:Transcript_69999/g.195823  ORF Transcript_69999/g.195823 Transcript_69999/m.195823 type:complete len:880 (-) Transcript_69999:41-2680(-)